jgi:hypothetical protein
VRHINPQILPPLHPTPRWRALLVSPDRAVDPAAHTRPKNRVKDESSYVERRTQTDSLSEETGLELSVPYVLTPDYRARLLAIVVPGAAVVATLVSCNQLIPKASWQGGVA